jgi:hypothetical protein
LVDEIVLVTAAKEEKDVPNGLADCMKLRTLLQKGAEGCKPVPALMRMSGVEDVIGSLNFDLRTWARTLDPGRPWPSLIR